MLEEQARGGRLLLQAVLEKDFRGDYAEGPVLSMGHAGPVWRLMLQQRFRSSV